MMLDSTHTSVPMLMRGNTPPTMRSPPHQSRPTGNPPNRQPATVGEEERGGRGPTSRRTSMRAAPNCKPPPTVRHAPSPHTSTSQSPPPVTRLSPQQSAPRHGEGGQRRRRTTAPCHTAGGGQRPGPAPAAYRPADPAPNATVPR
jgi:hypothetical protein